ncbi:MAG: hypothetical protein U0531_04520 [Dehalococcoidia bacterium]
MTLPAQACGRNGNRWCRNAPVAARRRRTAPRRPRRARQRPARPVRSAARHRRARQPAGPRREARATPGFYTAAGYLAAGCTITASVAGRDYAAFAQRYQIHTGHSLITPHDGLDVHERPTHKMGADLSVRFPATADVLSHFDLGVKPERDVDGTYVVRKAETVERLLKLGFDLGSNVDPWPVRDRVPEAQRPHFDRGITLRRTARR